ncbi:MAG: hypothetical protein P1V35_12680 [Planctomycetota bacterium]|nr:hypothetical protein [Planctomycetota bacterium]
MKISAANSHAQAMQASAAKNAMLPSQVSGQGSAASNAVPGGSPVQGPGAVDQGPASQSPSERLARFAAHMEERLSMLEEQGAESGMDLSQVRSDFQSHITRLQEAMANGLQGDDLANGIENTSNLVRDGVRDAMGLAAMRQGDAGQSAGNADGAGTTTNIDIEHSNGRLDAIEDRIQARLDSLFEAGSYVDKESVIGAREQFNGHMTRLRDALATGNMSGEDMRRSMETIMQHLQDNLGGVTTYASTAGDNGAASQAGSADQAATASVGQPATSVAEARVASRAQALTLLSQDIAASGNESFQPQLSDLLKPGSPAGDFLLEMREASHKAKGGGPEGYNQSAIKASLLSADLPGSSLNFKV